MGWGKPCWLSKPVLCVLFARHCARYLKQLERCFWAEGADGTDNTSGPSGLIGKKDPEVTEHPFGFKIFDLILFS